MKYSDNEYILKTFYQQNGLSSKFGSDSTYLEKAFNDINKLWLDNFAQIKTVNYLMIAEAPLWGELRQYIYNPDTDNTQFFYRSDLGKILNKNKDIANKREFLKVCNKIGLLVVDISPFPLNPNDTEINYRKLSSDEYRQLVSWTIPTYFERKLELVATKKSSNIKIFFRYARVKNNFQDLIAKVLRDHKFIKNKNEIGDISQKGGGIDKKKLGKIINANIKRAV